MSSSNSAAAVATAQSTAQSSAAVPARRGRVIRGLAAPATAPLTIIDARVVPSLPESPEALEREAERGYAEGFDRGYADGLTEGRSAMAAEVDTARSRLASAARALTTAAAELSRRQAGDMAQLEEVVAGLAYEIAAAVVGRELEVSHRLPADALARALALAPPAVAAVARFHPDDVAVMEVAVPLDRPVTVVADPSIEPGGCVVETGDCRIDAQISASLARVRLALVGDGALSLPVITFERMQAALDAARPRRYGSVRRVVGVHLEVSGLEAAIGDAVMVATPDGEVGGEVVALHGDSTVCMPFGELRGIRTGAPVWTPGTPPTIAVGSALLGRVLDGLGRPLDGKPLGPGLERVTVDGSAPHPLRRAHVDTQLPLGVRVLDTLIPCGSGQRLGIFAGSGVGKSSLLSMIARGTEAPVSVLALIGERGREVREFLDRDLGPEGLARSVVVVATSDQPALVRLRAAYTATRIAEWFRDTPCSVDGSSPGGSSNDVVLMMDSLTRFAMAQREIGLSAGEPPATRGYPPSVFSLLARLLERAGASEHGSITGLYTVLVDGDDMDEPIADCARSILDGHVVLSRRLATAGHFPTVEALESISRVVGAITSHEQRAAATTLRRLLAAQRDVKDLVEIGAYVAGTNPLADQALSLAEPIRAFLTQGIDEPAPAADSWAALQRLVAGAGG